MIGVLLHLASREAERLRHDFIVPLHLLCAIASDDSVAGTAAREAGVTRDKVESLLTAMAGADAGDEAAGVCTTPAWHGCEGFARGFAAGQGRTVTVADGLVAVLWTEHAWPWSDAPREAVRDALISRGISVPSGPLPPLWQPRWGERVDVPVADLRRVVAELPVMLPADATFCFNRDEDSAWVAATEGVDLQPILRRLLAAAR